MFNIIPSLQNITSLLQDKKWEKTSNNDAVNQFQFANGQQQFTARPRKMTGPGWEAGIDGCHAVSLHIAYYTDREDSICYIDVYASQVVGQDFLALMGKSSLECQQEVSSGRFPPCIVYKIIYSSPEERRVKRALMTVDVDGANVPLSFHCLVKEEMRECVHSLFVHYMWCGGEGGGYICKHLHLHMYILHGVHLLMCPLLYTAASPSPRISSPEHISYTGGR